MGGGTGTTAEVAPDPVVTAGTGAERPVAATLVPVDAAVAPGAPAVVTAATAAGVEPVGNPGPLKPGGILSSGVTYVLPAGAGATNRANT